jgi:hypothetical protein
VSQATEHDAGRALYCPQEQGARRARSSAQDSQAETAAQHPPTLPRHWRCRIA